MATKTSMARRKVLRTMGSAAVVAMSDQIFSPFRSTGGVAWAAPALPKKVNQWVYSGKPMTNDKLTAEQFEMREIAMPEPKQGQALIRVKLVGIHPQVRTHMATGIIKPGQPNSNFACGEVLKSRDRTMREGDVIACQAGWQDYAIVSSDDDPVRYDKPSEMVKELNGSNSQWTYVFRPAMVKSFAPEDLIGLMGTTGLTAYFGMREVGPLMPRDAVASAAITGATGSIAGQLAKIAGCYTVSFAGGAEKCKWAVETLGVDKCIDYRAKDLDAQVSAAFPNGIDVFSDGVGGEVRAAVLKVMNQNGRLINYGASARFYNDSVEAPTPAGQGTGIRFGITEEDLRIFKQKNIKVETWIVDDFYQDRIKAENDLARLVQSGALKPVNTVFEGLDKVPEALISMYSGSRYGKLSVRFAK